ncbi:hypothetical protein [Hymenobacter sp. B1770]|uniref:hypothetical protein n=1 Tax=Hymenobacter sp. B1770 TaxID=1718788 RepID=UPI003CF3489A
MKPKFTHELDFRQERDFGQKISATLEFISAHFRPLGRVLLYLVVPAVLLQGLASALFDAELFGSVQGAMREQGLGLTGLLQGGMWGTMLSTPAYWIKTILGTAVFTLLLLSVYGYVKLCLCPQPASGEVRVAEVWAVVRQEFVGTFFSAWGLSFLITAGFFLLVIPGIYFSVALSLFFVVKMVEGTGFGETLSRCLQLTSGKWWSTFGLIAIMLFIFYLVIVGIGISVTLFSGGLSAMFQVSRLHSPVFSIMMASLNSLVLLLLLPPLLVALAFQYFNLVERRDGVGLRRLIDSLGQTSAPQATNSTYQPDEEGEY